MHGTFLCKKKLHEKKKLLESLVDSELMVALSHNQWAATNKDEADLMALLRDMPDAIEDKGQDPVDHDEEESPEPDATEGPALPP